jgi:hypothetical protein
LKVASFLFVLFRLYFISQRTKRNNATHTSTTILFFASTVSSSKMSSVATLSPFQPAFSKSKDESEDEWSHFEDPDEGTNQEASAAECSSLLPLFEFSQLPPQLHPAVSLGAQRVSSCYFSLGSERENSVADLLSQFGDDTTSVDASGHENHNATTRNNHYSNDGADILYHDILMNVFTFLDAPSITAFSETARRPNFEVFYFLQLQLQRALLVATEGEEADNDPLDSFYGRPQQDDSLTAIAGSACLSRLAQLDMAQAQSVVNEYLESNSTLRTMPLSHSLAYFRHALLQRSGFFRNYYKEPRDGSERRAPPAQALASAALLVTVMGAAVMTGSAPADAAALADSFGSELPNMIFGVGFVGSALMATRRQMNHPEPLSSDVEKEPTTMRGRAEQMGRALHMPEQFRLPSLIELRRTLHETLSGNESNRRANSTDKDTVISSNPYDHLPVIDEKKEEEDEDLDHQSQQAQGPAPKIPSGSVGAYSRAIHDAASAVTLIVKERRKARFQALPDDEQRQLPLAFLDACSSDGNLVLVKDMIHTMDVDAFFVGSDGSETCALHTAAFHGAAKVLDFLCRGIDYGDDVRTESSGRHCGPPQDGGLCDIDAIDSNGWTALHFAAGANAVTAAEILASYGAQLSVEASNGYSPLLWAQRLSNEQVAEKLKVLLAARGADQTAWISSRPLSQIAHQFFSLMPSH